MTRILILTIAILAATVLAKAATAASMCGPAQLITDVIEQKNGEQRTTGGLAAGGAAVLEVWANDETGSWTAVMFSPAGGACILSFGQYWQTYVDENPS